MKLVGRIKFLHEASWNFKLCRLVSLLDERVYRKDMQELQTVAKFRHEEEEGKDNHTCAKQTNAPGA